MKSFVPLLLALAIGAGQAPHAVAATANQHSSAKSAKAAKLVKKAKG
jgi:hypothetical protein